MILKLSVFKKRLFGNLLNNKKTEILNSLIQCIRELVRMVKHLILYFQVFAFFCLAYAVLKNEP